MVYAIPPIYAPDAPRNLAPYPAAPVYDFRRNAFVRMPNGQPLVHDGHAAWVQWCVKATLTERNTYLAYGPNHGTEIDRIIGTNDAALAHAKIAATITGALTRNRFTEAVDMFEFTDQADGTAVSFRVTSIVGTTETINLLFSGG